MTRVLVTGCRDWFCHDIADLCVERMKAKYADLVIVHGAAKGVDRSFENACYNHRVATEPHPADWDRHGKAAGPKRNDEMVALGAAFCLAVHRDLAGSKGTRDCVMKCLAAGIPVYLIDGNYEALGWLPLRRRITSV